MCESNVVPIRLLPSGQSQVAFSTNATEQPNQLAGMQHPAGHVVLLQKQHTGTE